jgi:tetratricopeptide (TPR) repeat protein
LFAPVAIGLQYLVDHFRQRSPALQHVVGAFILLLLVGFGAGTYIRNLAWLDHKTFWEDAAAKAPLSMRPVHNLAYYHYEKRGEYQKAFELYHRALELEDNNRLILSLPHVKIAEYYDRRGDFDQAAAHLDRALAIFPGFEKVQYRLALALAQTTDLERALATVRPLVARHPDSFDCNYLMAQILLKISRIEDAIGHLRHCLKLAPDSAKAIFMMGIALNLKGDWQPAEALLHAVLERYPSDKHALLWMMDCQLQRLDEALAADSALKFLEGMQPTEALGAIVKILDDNFMPDDAKERLYRWVAIQAQNLNPDGRSPSTVDGNDPAHQRYNL